MEQKPLRIVPVFFPEDQAWIRRSSIIVPQFWEGLAAAPATEDVLRFGGRQFTVKGRMWEHDGTGAILRLYLSSAYAESETAFG